MPKKLTAPLSSGTAGVTARALLTAPSVPLPATLKPQLATLANVIPTVGNWAYEIKFDGYRILARFEGGAVQLFTRNCHDWTAKLQTLASELEALNIESAWLDGEAVVMGENGIPNFNALQNAFDSASTNSIVLYFFDVPFLDGRDLRKLPLSTRRAILEERLSRSTSSRIRFSATFGTDGASVRRSACKLGLEGVIAKRLDATYETRRTETWLKLKCHRRQEFVIGGFTNRSGNGKEVGSLLLGVYDNEGKLRSAGSVGTGWNASEGAALWRRLVRLEIDLPPFASDYLPAKGRWSKRSAGSERWVKPTLVAEVSFNEWTPEGNVRHPAFEGLRIDKPAKSIRREYAAPFASPATKLRPRGNRSSSIKISNADRIIDASSGLKKIDLVRYYEDIAPHILPHIEARPTSLVRGPDGVGGELFFQKHGERIGIPGIRELDPSLWPGHKGLLTVPTAQALIGAAQLNVIEFHTWNSSVRDIDKPDRMIFDLDPGEGVAWSDIQEGATLTRVLLTALGLESWLKTSGGKGLHVVVPLAPRLDYDTVSAFSKAIVVHLTKTIPSRFVSKSGGKNRVGKIFVDYIRNGHGATTAAAFSARARPGLGVSMPIAWEGLSNVPSGNHWSIVSASQYMSLRAVDPWRDYWSSAQTLEHSMEHLGFNIKIRHR